MDVQYITVKKAAEISGYHPDHLRVLIREGRIEADKFGPVWAIDRESLLAFLKDRQEAGEKRGPKT
jgi:excisionase family DNA binding protein